MGVVECDIQECVQGAGYAAISKLELFCDKGGLLSKLQVFLSTGVSLEASAELCANPESDFSAATWTSAKDDFVAAEDTYNTGCLEDLQEAIHRTCDGMTECKFDNHAIQYAMEQCNDFTTTDYVLSVNSECGPGGIDATTVLALTMIMFVALALGCTLTWAQFYKVLTSKRRAFFIGFASQFGFMPFMSWSLAQAFGFSNLVSTGIVLVGCAPGGSTSNLFTYWIKGNVALSIAMSSASTLCALFMLPLLIVVYVQSTFQDDDTIDIPYSNIIISLLAIVIPVMIGVFIRACNIMCCCGTKKLHEVLEKIGGGLGAFFLIAAAVSGVNDNPEFFVNFGDYLNVWILAIIFQPIGCSFGWTVARLCNMNGPDTRAIAMETGVQSYALILAIVNLSYSGCVRSEVIQFVLIATFVYVISSAWLVTFFRSISGWMDSEEDNEEDEESIKMRRGSKNEI